jgi:hypothetical protein
VEEPASAGAFTPVRAVERAFHLARCAAAGSASGRAAS